jgi:acyl dehydratase
MGETLSFTAAPDLRRLFLTALVNGRVTGSSIPDVTAQRRSVQIDPDHAVDYARLCGFPVGNALPVTYPHVLGFPLQVALMSRRDFPLPLVGLVHLENTIAWTRPLTMDDSLDISVHATNLRGHKRGRLVDLVTEVSAPAEPAAAPVWRGVSTYLARGTGDETAASPPLPDVTAVRNIGGGATWRLDEAVGRRYAGVSGDVNPIHLHALTARALGLDRAIAHGMYTYARAVAGIGSKIPAGGSSTVWFRKPVKLPSTVLLKVSADGRLAVLLPAEGTGEHLVVRTRPA